MDYRDYQAGVDGQHFWFKSKKGLIHNLLSDVMQGKGRVAILNVGVGTGDDLTTIQQFGTVYVLDIDQHALDMIPENIVCEKKLADVCAIPYPDKMFDLVVAFDVMEHVNDDQKMIDEIYRVLKPGGNYVFTVPAFNFLYSGHDRILHHFRRYNKKMIRPLMKKFVEISLAYWFFLLFIPAALSRLIRRKSEVLSMCKIPASLNTIFCWMLCFENYLISCGWSFPFGLTLYGIYRKEE